MKASGRVFANVGAVLVAAALTVSCSGSTGGTAVPQRATTSASAPANSPIAPPPPTAALSEEDQVRETVMAFQDAYNTRNWDAYTELMCSSMRAKFTGPVMDYVKKGRADTGMTTIKAITSVLITGETATATMDSENEAMGSRSVTLPLKREDGWKICQTF